MQSCKNYQPLPFLKNWPNCSSSNMCFFMLSNYFEVTKNKVWVRVSVNKGSTHWKLMVHLKSMHLERKFDKQDWNCMTISLWVSGGICSMERKQPFLMESVSNMNKIFHPVKCTTWELRQCNSIYVLVWSEAFGALSLSCRWYHLWGLNGTRHYKNFLWKSRSFYILFSR